MQAAGRTLSRACSSMSIGLEAVGEQEINSMMKQYDRDGDGTYSIDEVRAMVSVLGQEKKGKKMMTKLACGVFALFLLVLVGNAALTFAVVFLGRALVQRPACRPGGTGRVFPPAWRSRTRLWS